ncbi:MAG: leucine-rich repeat domain-containing protein, partial [Erysipelotrichaceae bacterium]|nr:leucine-rich repeat domain-containing protein [Erysipelotrichaceae bacterium]
MKKGKNLVIFSFVCALVTSACLLLSVSAEEGEEGATEIIEYYEEPSDTGSYVEDVPEYFGATEEFTTEVFNEYEGGDEPTYIPEENGGVEYVPEYVPEIPTESGDYYVTDTTEVSGNYAQDGPVDNEQYYQQFVNPDYVPEHSSSNQSTYVSGEVSVNNSDSTTSYSSTTSSSSTTYSSGTYSGMSIVREDPGPDYEYYASGALTTEDGEETDYSYKLDNNGYCIVYYGKPIETVKSGILDEYKNFVQKIIIEEGNKEFTYEGSFTDFNVLEEVQLPASIGNTRNLFENCINLRKVTFFGGTTYDSSNEPLTLGDKAFKNCISLQEVILPEDRDVYFENSVFANCIELETITLPEHFMGGGEDIFKGCTALKSIDLPASVSRIKNGSFEECTALTSMSVYANLEAVEVNAFKHTSQLKNICV